jgi:predicted nucleic acid-binding protein
MQLALDSNILFSYFKKDSKTRELIVMIEFFELCTLRSRIDELANHCDEICRKAKINKEPFFESLEEMALFVAVIEDEEASLKAEEGKKLAPHIEDAPLFALALTLGCPIWSKEEAFKDQKQVKVYNTQDLIRLLRLGD